MRYDEFYYTKSATPGSHPQFILYGEKDGRGHHLATFTNEECVRLAVDSMNKANYREGE